MDALRIYVLLATLVGCVFMHEAISRDRRAAFGDFTGVIKARENVYVALGYALGNSIMIITPDKSLIIVDTSDSFQAAEKILKEFRKISTLPIKAIIYTHHHFDHIGGAKAFVEDPANPPDVWSHELLIKENEEYAAYARKARYARIMRQFGVFVNGSQNSVDLGHSRARFAPVYPNRLVSGPETNVTIAGLDMTLIHLEGETVDQIGVWIPSMDTFLPGDTFYESFPNIYTIRGAPIRDPIAWYKSIDKIIKLNPEHLVPSHREPLSGKKAISDLLVSYRDAIQYMHDQAVRYINRGLTPDEVTRLVKLPKSLTDLPFLVEQYGKVEWCVKGVFQKYLGWFSGNPVDLMPLSFPEQALQMAKLVGGADVLASKAAEEAKNGSSAWALQLASYALQADPDNALARETKITCLNSIADKEINTNAQNYLRTAAMETAGSLDLFSPRKSVDVSAIDVRVLFMVLPTAFKPEVCGSTNVTIYIQFNDTGRSFCMHTRNSVLVVMEDEEPPEYTVKIVITESSFKDLFSRKMQLSALASSINITGDVPKINFMKECFEM